VRDVGVVSRSVENRAPVAGVRRLRPAKEGLLPCADFS